MGLASVRARLDFLRGGLRWIIIWPLVSIIISGAGWYLLDTRSEAEGRRVVASATREAEALARGYAYQLARAVESVDQI
ncbi:MAG: hypothetical protein JWQ00_2146, partial [Noviherbaspirillum sp.]|nr:hypothetical protein [Noviherbaspirillum sp.]